MMWPFGPQLIPAGSAVRHTVTTGPPASGTFLISPLVGCLLSGCQKPTHCPSGEKKGLTAQSVPSIGVACDRSILRRYNRRARSLAAEMLAGDGSETSFELSGSAPMN